jgi:L-threonylcarbamoyladenylate synthase
MVTISQFEIEQAAEQLRAGRLVAFPTETVYGLGANALDADAVAKIFELKGRPRFDPLIVHIAQRSQADGLVETIPEKADRLMQQFWPGPLSIVLDKSERIPDIVTSGLPRVALRCPAHPIARQLISAAGVPVAAPSANRFGCISPTAADHVRQQFGDAAPRILDGGPCVVGVESTVVLVDDHDVVLLRPGGVTLEELRASVGSVDIGGSNDSKPVSPGQLSRHYAPTTPLRLGGDRSSFSNTARVGLLTLSAPKTEAGFAAVETLSPTGCLREAATNLFAALRRLDQQDLDVIIADPVPEQGLGLAIMDRLRRAAAKADAT